MSLKKWCFHCNRRLSYDMFNEDSKFYGSGKNWICIDCVKSLKKIQWYLIGIGALCALTFVIEYVFIVR